MAIASLVGIVQVFCPGFLDGFQECGLKVSTVGKAPGSEPVRSEFRNAVANKIFRNARHRNSANSGFVRVPVFRHFGLLLVGLDVFRKSIRVLL